MIVVGAAIIRDGEILIVRAENHSRTWIFPGGKKEEGETPKEGLARELHEELPGLRFTIRGFLGVYTAYISRVGKVRLIVYRVSSGVRYKLGDEIAEARWVKDPEKLHLANPTAQAISILRKRGIL